MAEKTVTIRLALEDADKVRRALEDLGERGKAAIDRIDRGSTEHLRGQFDRLTRAMGPVARSAHELEGRLALLDRAFRAGAITEAEHARAAAQARVQHEALAASFQRVEHGGRLAAHQITNLGYQIQDVAVQLAGGQNPFLILVQQGPQAAGAVGGLGNLMRLMLSPTGLAVGGLLAFGAAAALVVARAFAVNEQIRALTVTLRAFGSASQSAEGLRALARDLYVGGAGRDEALAAAQEIARRRTLSSARGAEVAGLGADLAAATGQSVADAVKAVADAIEGGYAAVKKLDDGFNFLTAAELRQIRTLAEHGDKAKALDIALAALHRRFDGLREQAMGPAEKAMHGLGVAFNDFIDAVAKSETVIGLVDSLSQGLAVTAKWIKGDAAAGQPATAPATGAPTFDPAAALNAERERQKKIVDTAADAQHRLATAMRGTAVERELNLARLKAEDEALDHNLDGQERARLIATRIAEAKLRLRVAVEDLNRTTAAEVAGTLRVAEAHGVSAEAARQAAIAAKADIEIAKGSIETRERIIARLEAQEAAQRRLADAQKLAEFRAENAGNDRLAAALAGGQDIADTVRALHDAELANRAYDLVRRQGLAGQRDENAALEYWLSLLKEGDRALAAVTAGRARLDLARQRQGLEDEIAAARMPEAQGELWLAGRRDQARMVDMGGQQWPDADRQRWLEETKQFREREQWWRRDQTLIRDLEGIGERAFSRIGEAMTSMAMEGKNAWESLGNIGKAVMSELMQEGMRYALLNPLKNLLFGQNSATMDDVLAKAGTKIGGWLGGGEGGGGSGSAGGFLSGIGDWIAGLFHTGGIVGQTAVTTRAVPAAVFAGAPRYHAGGWAGLDPSEVPAILKRGEAVLTPEQAARLRTGPGREARPVTVVMNISTPDASGFRASQGQIATEAARAMERARRNF